MFLLRRPSLQFIDRVLDAQHAEPLSYPDPGITRSHEARGYRRNHHHLNLGSGSDTYHRAVAAVQAWAMYDLPWTSVHPAKPPVRVGSTFATIVHHLGFWSINPCRVVYVDESESAGARSYSFAIGTLAPHSERGEERFLVEWDQERDRVRFEILAHAVPQHWMARVGAPYVRLLQTRFARQALQAVRAHVRRREGAAQH